MFAATLNGNTIRIKTQQYTYHGYYREDFVFARQPGVERFSKLNPDNAWYGRLKLLFTMSVKIDGKEEAVDIESVCLLVL